MKLTSLRPWAAVLLVVAPFARAQSSEPAAKAPATETKPLTEAHATGKERISWFSSPPRVSWRGGAVQVRNGQETRFYDPATMEEVAVDAGGAANRTPGPRGPRRPRSDRGREEGNRKIVTKSPSSDLADASLYSWVEDGNLFVGSRLASGAWRGEPWQVTVDGSDEMLYGMLDWVYQEELYGRGNFRGHWWSPDGKNLAFLRLDEAPVREFVVVDHVPKGSLETERAVVAEITNYPKAGDPNPTCSVGIANVDDRSVQWVDLSAYPEDRLVVRVSWTPSGDKAVLQIQDRIQTWMELCYADPATGEVTRVLRETSPTWVNRLPAPDWQPDGTFLWLSERTGYQHLYHYRPDGQLICAVTSGEWQVRDVEKVDFEKGLVWFEGTADGAIDRNLYRVGLDGTGRVRLTTGEGQHSWTWNDDRSFFIDTVSSIETPGEVRLCRGDTGEVVHVFGSEQPEGASEYFYSPKRRLVITARDGYPLDATVVPAAPGSERPGIYLSTYSGPDAPSVRNRFGVSSQEQYLAQQGVISLQVNVRSASGRGQAHTGTCYKQLGVQELKDLEDAVRYVIEEYGADPERVAITGWSYGGFMAAYALTHSDVFTLGFAGAGVHDWQLYDTIYTERYMSTPQLNPEGYKASSVIRAADKLHGHLVILHGTMDDNVHLQNSIQLVYALQEAEHDDFELMVYPRSRHGVRSSHRNRFVWRILKREFGI